MRVRVTFHVEATDPDHSLGISEEDYELITDTVMGLGAEDAPEFEKVED